LESISRAAKFITDRSRLSSYTKYRREGAIHNPDLYYSRLSLNTYCTVY